MRLKQTTMAKKLCGTICSNICLFEKGDLGPNRWFHNTLMMRNFIILAYMAAKSIVSVYVAVKKAQAQVEP